MGMVEKQRFRYFLVYVAQYDESKPNTHQGRDFHTLTMQECFDSFSLD
jgi:Rab GDP dissociation inhibitor